MTDRKKRIRKKRRKKQIEKMRRMLIAYSLRALVVFTLMLMAVLMICGCLYIYEHVFQKSNVQEANAYFGALAQLEGKDPETVGKAGARYTIVLDPGHGGNDRGTEEGRAVEKEINLAIALKVKERLEEEKIRVILTRDQDIYVDLDERVQKANNENADLFVSLHCNYYDKDSSIRGFECYYDRDSERGKYYGERLIREIEERKKITSRNAKPENYHVLRNAQVPAVLVEMGFLSNYAERTDLMDAGYQDELAAEVADGIVKGLEGV